MTDRQLARKIARALTSYEATIMWCICNQTKPPKHVHGKGTFPAVQDAIAAKIESILRSSRKRKRGTK